MANGGVRVEGLSRLVRDLQALGVDIDDLKRPFSELAAEGASIAASVAPRDTGKLAASIRGNRSRNSAVVTAGKASVPYAAVTNWGWKAKGRKPTLFMQHADEQLRPHVVPRIESELDRLIRQHHLN